MACILISAALIVPVGAATWFTRGTYEPDTACDTSLGCTTPGGQTVAGGYMFQHADTEEGGMRIYFNGYAQTVFSTMVNPNNEVLGTRLAHSKNLEAYLGVWKDCNDDGYIGAGLGAVHFYKSDAFPLTPACPDGSIFNRNGWVYEFIWIGAGGQRAGDEDYPSADDQRWINDTSAMVWVDFGLPGTAQGPTCPIQPWPQGTTGSTGGFLMFADCFTAHRVAETVNAIDGDGSLGIRFDDPAEPQKSDSLLNQEFIIHPWNYPYSGPNHDENDTGFWDENSQRDWNDADETDEDTAFHVWDCSQPAATTVESPANEDPTGGDVRGDGTLFGEDGHIIEIAAISPGVDDPVGGSYYDSINATERGALNAQAGGGTGLLSYDGHLGRGDGSDGMRSSNCDREQTTLGMDQVCAEEEADSPNPRRFTTTWCLTGIEGLGVAGTEAAFVQTGFAAIRENSDAMSFSLGGQPPRGKQTGNVAITHPLTGGHVFAVDVEDGIKNETGSDTGDVLNATLGEGYQYGPDIWGLVVLRPGWSGQVNMARSNCCVLINTDTLQPHSAQWLTFYAKIGPATTAMGAKTPKDNVASIYGNEWCNGARSGESTNPPGFDCDPAHWWNPEFGASAMFTANGFDLGARAGETYHLRDIDCYDGTVLRGSGIKASLVDFSAEGDCVDAP